MSDNPGFDNQLILEYLVSRKKKQFKPRTDHFLWEEMDFIARFRMSKNMVRQLTSLIANDITTSTNKNHAVCALDQVLITLHFYATGTMQRCTGDISGVHKSTVSRIIDRVSRAIARRRSEYIVFPQTQNEIQQCANEFYSIARFPNTIGAIDCTHVGILSPGGNNAEYYRNRKDYFSYNVQAIVDANCKITNIVARWPGSTHDSTIFNNSRIKGKLEDGLYGGRHLVGDRGYAVKPYLLTPLSNPVSDAERLYNESQIRTRNVVERTFGIWKRRFPAIGMKLRIDATRVEAVIVATAVLHNICTNNNDIEPPDVVTILQEIDAGHFPENDRQGNNDIRQNLVNAYFAHLL